MVTVRRAKEGDASPLASLAERTFRDAFEAQNTPGDMALHCARSYGAELQRREISDPGTVTLIAELEDRLVGYGQLRLESAVPCVPARRPAEIQRIYVDRAWHGAGVGRLLMASLLEAARSGGADAVWLGVWERNPRAIAFYVKQGFVAVGDHSFLLGTDPQRDVVMRYDFPT